MLAEILHSVSALNLKLKISAGLSLGNEYI
jgi:hypothetical protein